MSAAIKERPKVMTETPALTEDRSAATGGELRDAYGIMRRIRTLEESLTSALKMGQVRAPYYPVRGLEAACAAFGVVLRRTDYLVSTYRCTADVVAKGVPLREVVGEIFGKETGTSKGKGGSMHMAAPHHGLMATTGVVGAGAPIACGLGLASKMSGKDTVTLCTFGDGATSIGAVHESLNLAATWDLPVVFFCQNNQWAEHTSISTYTKNTDLSQRAASLGMRTARVDGFDVRELLSTLHEATAHARNGGGPTFVESLSYRLGPHSFGWDDSYLSPELKADGMERDPVITLRRELIEQGALAPAEADDIDSKIVEEVEDAIVFSQAAGPTPAEELLLDVYATDLDGAVR
ncbi:thiamine pyrophosphate-dependent dehydrogenase E1 component subunit alpha [Amycolatopsis acidicola]|uniref:Thiamine pyrophosphate-dependent dehydrogenase E1 component subunit alpha n=1 Tax=Amycolatopsis acidicola TaxID=2596893 RepID=A0A5N0VF29_9PSEU|nr:thiamine pyrophosphate-dependent dehydrogenase E1 component subunit alpha [Amycolatopsis acidicola]KAA9164054.1 thiamine pyrophosphate-dependent dehydrogenase E1 component subunit alpha [Amycolatopsis acidicola]